MCIYNIAMYFVSIILIQNAFYGETDSEFRFRDASVVGLLGPGNEGMRKSPYIPLHIH